MLRLSVPLNQSITRKVSSVVFGLLVAIAAAQPLQAQTTAAGQVEATRGVGFVQSPGATPRTLGLGAAVNEGDTLTTGKDSFAVVKLTDGTRMTVRPETQLVVQNYRYNANAPASTSSMVLGLLRGGLRTITGLIAKSSPDAAKIRTSTATIGIRGTDFDARICNGTCVAEGRAAGAGTTPRTAVIPASARIVRANGDVQAVAADGQKRKVVVGGALYNGDTVETAAGGAAIVAFRDDTRMGLGSASKFKIDNFVYDQKTPSEGRFLINFLRGTARVVTGLIGKSDNRNVRVSTSTATIGIRGTEFVLSCLGACAGEPGQPGQGFLSFTLTGETIAQLLAAGIDFPMPAGSGVEIGADGQPVRLSQLPPGQVPAIDIVIDLDQLFGLKPPVDGENGLFVFVREGHIEMDAGGNLLHLGRGETGQLGSDGVPIRPALVPLFIDFDKTPLPSGVSSLLTLLRDDGLNPTRVCR